MFFRFFCGPESALYCDLNHPLGALEKASIKVGNKEYDCLHGAAACASPAALCRAGSAAAAASHPRAPELHFGAALGPSPACRAPLCSAELSCTRHCRLSRSSLESSGPSPGSGGMLGVFRFCLRSSWGGAREVITLVGKVLEAQKHSYRLQSPSPGAKRHSWVML